MLDRYGKQRFLVLAATWKFMKVPTFVPRYCKSNLCYLEFPRYRIAAFAKLPIVVSMFPWRPLGAST